MDYDLKHEASHLKLIREVVRTSYLTLTGEVVQRLQRAVEAVKEPSGATLVRQTFDGKEFQVLVNTTGVNEYYGTIIQLIWRLGRGAARTPTHSWELARVAENNGLPWGSRGDAATLLVLGSAAEAFDVARGISRRDLYMLVAAKLFGIPYNQVSPNQRREVTTQMFDELHRTRYFQESP